MEDNTSLITVFYLVSSLVAFLVFYFASKKISGINFKAKWFWTYFSLSVLWGMAQLNVARNGYILFFPSSSEFLVTNYLIRWVAFISAIF